MTPVLNSSGVLSRSLGHTAEVAVPLLVSETYRDTLRSSCFFRLPPHANV